MSFIEVIETIISALKKQAPEKPIEEKICVATIFGKEECYTYKYCPSCSAFVENEKYCPNCGQALDWSDSE